MESVFLAFFLLVSDPFYPASGLQGQHVCSVLKLSTVVERVSELTPYQVLEKTLCLNIPPLCSRYKIKYRLVYKNRTLVKTRLEEECCKGYTRNLQENCIPVCSDDCVHGTCVGPDTCHCQEGYGGPRCSISENFILWCEGSFVLAVLLVAILMAVVGGMYVYRKHKVSTLKPEVPRIHIIADPTGSVNGAYESIYNCSLAKDRVDFNGHIYDELEIKVENNDAYDHLQFNRPNRLIRLHYRQISIEPVSDSSLKE